MFFTILKYIILWIIFCVLASLVMLTPLLSNIFLAIFSLLFYVIATFLFLFWVGAEFFSLLFLSIYAGAIVVLFAFAAMLVGPSATEVAPGFSEYSLPTEHFLSLGYFTFLKVVFIKNVQVSKFLLRLKEQVFPPNPTGGYFDDLSDVEAIGRLLYTDTFILFFFVGVLFFLVLVALVLLCMKMK